MRGGHSKGKKKYVPKDKDQGGEKADLGKGGDDLVKPNVMRGGRSKSKKKYVPKDRGQGGSSKPDTNKGGGELDDITTSAPKTMQAIVDDTEVQEDMMEAGPVYNYIEYGFDPRIINAWFENKK